MNRTALRTLSLTVVAASALMSTSAEAVTSTRTQVQNGAGACNSALPVFDGNIRKRPLAIANEGTGNAFVTCSLAAADYTDSLNDFNGVALSNRNAADVDITCTLVTGTVGGFPATYFPKTISVPAGASVVLEWDATTDNGGVLFGNTMNYSCNLHPGTDVNAAFTNVNVDVGA